MANKKDKKKLTEDELQFIDVIQTAIKKLKVNFELESIEVEADNGFHKKYHLVIKEITY